MRDKLTELDTKIIEKTPLIHCIMGAVSANFCANGVLSLGAKPIMAQHICEVREITASSDALLVNFSGIIGESAWVMCRAIATANKKNIPVVLDVVGIACSRYRYMLAKRLINKYNPDVIKGNFSEIYALFDKSYKSTGVDNCGEISLQNMIRISGTLAKKYNTIILASGETDIVCDGTHCYLVKNGVARLTEITATGCLLGAIVATFSACERSVISVVAACARLGLAGETAATYGDCFSVRLLDCLRETEYKNLKIEES